jgi:hypothetical protein
MTSDKSDKTEKSNDDKPAETVKKAFKRVAIEEDSDEEEDPKIEEITDSSES